MRRAASTWSSVAWRPLAKAVAPAPTRAGVLGITRTTGVSGGKNDSSVLRVTPAATETTNVSGFNRGAASCSTATTTSGLTATITTSATSTASPLDAVRAPSSRAVSCKRVSSASASQTCSGATRPARTIPAANALPIAPAPMHATFPMPFVCFPLLRLIVTSRDVDANVARGKQKEGFAEAVHAPVQRVGGAANKIDEAAGDVLRHPFNGQNDRLSIFQPVRHLLHFVKTAGLLHDDVEARVAVAPARAGQADDAASPRL